MHLIENQIGKYEEGNAVLTENIYVPDPLSEQISCVQFGFWVAEQGTVCFVRYKVSINLVLRRIE